MSRKRIKVRVSSEREDDEEEQEVHPVKRARRTQTRKTQDKSSYSDIQENVTQNNVVEIMNMVEPALPPQRTIQQQNSIAAKISANLKSGKIKRIHLQNFMCHGNFEVNLNQCINVIVGLNGSGKSSILSAISIGLGSKATATSRSTSLKDFVRRGETAATIEITLTNDGVESFENDLYGDEITVIRNINANSGASTYKLKNHAGKVVSHSRQDLVKMCMCLNIQVDNPVLILNQDAARSFLKECDPKKLYQLFMKATQIESIIDKLNSCFKIAVTSKNQLENLDKTVKHNEIDIQVLREKHSRLQSVNNLRESIMNYKNEIAWLQVTNVERDLLNFQRDLTNKRAEVDRINDFINNREKYERETIEKIRQLGSEFKVLDDKANECTKMYDKSRKDFETERDKLSEFENTFQSYSDRLNKKVLPNIAQLEQDIAEYENNPANVDNMRLENEEKIKTIEEKRQNLAAVLMNCRRDHESFLQTFADHKDGLDETRVMLRREQEQIIKMENQIAQYKNAGKDTLSVYGPSTSRLLNEIDHLYRQKRFSQMPRGPFGRYIEVPMRKYRQAVEHILGGTLRSFAVNNDQDRMLLTQVLKKYKDFARTQIITTEFVNQVYDVSNGIAQVETEGDILINVIKVSDPVVMNCLIDQNGIERVVLVEDTDTAIALTQDQQNVPYNLSRVVLLQPFSEYFPSPNYRSYSIREQPLRYIQTNFQELINALARSKTVHEEKSIDIQNKLKQITNKIAEFEKLVNDKKKAMIELQRKDNALNREIEELKAIEFPENTDINFLRQQLADEKRLKEGLERKINQSTDKHNTLKEIVKDRKNISDRYLAENRESRSTMVNVRTQIETEQRNLDMMKNEIETKGRQIADLTAEQNAIVNVVREHENKIKEMTSKIKGKRVTTHQSEENLKNAIRSAEKRIQRIESSNENIEDVELLLTNKIDQVDTMRSIHRALEQVLKRLTSIRETRYIYIRKLRQHMSLRVKHKFYQLMQLRNYTADVEIDHKEQKLTLKVIPRDAQIEGAVSNTKSLSGGERSYSTVAFLISLWSCVDHPFYFLDEYDVFSDEYNRHIMTQLLLNEAGKRKDKQYGFLTPQEFSNIQATNNVTIHKLQDPERMN